MLSVVSAVDNSPNILCPLRSLSLRSLKDRSGDLRIDLNLKEEGCCTPKSKIQYNGSVGVKHKKYSK